jgi:streptomycin 6-kinase
MTLRISDVIRRKAEVNDAAAWLDGVDALVAEHADEWDLDVGSVLDGGTEAVVVEVTDRSSGRLGALKACLPRGAGDHAVAEIAVLRLAEGQGCAELWFADADAGVFVIERLGPSLDQMALPIDQRHRVMAAAAAAMWRPLGDDQPFMTGAEKGRWLVDFIADTWERLNRPCSPAAVESALECARHRIDAHDDDRAVLVHGDVHQWNTLSTLDGSGFKLIDPDGLFAQPEYDLGIIMREDPVELLSDPRERSHRLAALTGRDETAIWEWGVVERVSTGLLCVEVGLEPVGTQMLRTAEAVAGLG